MHSQKATLGRLRSKLGPSFNLDDDEYVSNNLLKLNVFYEHLLLKNIEESPGYTVGLHRTCHMPYLTLSSIQWLAHRVIHAFHSSDDDEIATILSAFENRLRAG